MSKALQKNPTQRYASMAEMAQAVDGLNAPAPAAPPTPPPNHTVPVVQPVSNGSFPSVIPVPPISLRGQIGELSGSMAIAAVIAFLATILWAAVLGEPKLELLGSLFFTTVALSWSVLLPAKYGPSADSRDRCQTRGPVHAASPGYCCNVGPHVKSGMRRR